MLVSNRDALNDVAAIQKYQAKFNADVESDKILAIAENASRIHNMTAVKMVALTRE